jgi:dipeptidyl aminopeptidase/acylaminoacyl peptidase
MLRELELKAKYERGGWPSQPRPDIKPPEGWSIPLITSVGKPRSHTLSPRARKIAFIWDFADASDIYVMSTEGGWPARMTSVRLPRAPWFDDPPQWSPNGEWIAYTEQNHVWIIPTTGGMPRKITSFTTRAESPRWMPDGTHLLVEVERDERQRILLTDIEGSWPQPISQGPGHDYDPHASPDGRYVVYTHTPLDDLDRSDIVLADVEIGSIRTLSGIPEIEATSPQFSPDGQWIAYLSEKSGYFELYLIHVKTGEEHQLTHLGYDVSDIAWSPDGSRIACTVNKRGALNLAIVEVENGQVEYLRNEPGVHMLPQWSPDNQSIIFGFESPLMPQDIYAIDVETKQLQQLTFSNPPALQALELIIPEEILYTSHDGLEIPAFLYRPKEPNGAAIIYPHGGPTTQYLLEWDIWAQYMIAKGYTWLAPNFRGSTGYGFSFERANHYTWGVDDTEDCLAGADYLSTLDWIDSSRIAIYGASYGSYLVVCALAFDPKYRFECGIAKYGDCNILSSWAQSDRSVREDMERMMGHPSDDPDAYRSGSPVRHVDKIKRPLLIVHGLLDKIVHPLQSEELVEALKREGKTFEYKTYPDEGHGLLRRKNQIDFYQHMERFCDWYLI